MINVGVIGAGTMGSTHAYAYAQLPNARVVGVADIDVEKARRVVAQSGGTAWATAEEAIDNPQVDVVDVCVPTFLHRRYVEQALAAGKHVYCEKPLARTLADGWAMVQAAEKAGRQLGVGHVVRFFSNYRQAREMVREGKLGQIGIIRTSRGGGGFPYAWQDWYANFEWSGGMILDLLIHDFDWLRWTLGEVERVFARSTHGRDFNREEYALVTLRFANGAMAHVEGTWLHAGGFTTSFEICGSQGMLSSDAAETRPLVLVTPPSPSAPGVAVPEVPGESPYLAELRAFVDALDAGQPVPVNGREGYEALKIALAALRSVETGSPVNPAELEAEAGLAGKGE